MSVANIGKLQEKLRCTVQNGCEIFTAKGQHFRTKRVILQPCKIFLQLGVIASNGCNSFISSPNHTSFKALDCDFLSFKMTYSMHKLDYRKCSKGGLHDCHQECFMLDFSLLLLLAFWICLWKRTLKLRFSMFLSFTLLCHGFERTLLNLGLLWKDHFPLPFIDQVLERVSGHPFCCFLDGYSGYFQIEIDVEDQEKTTFTCPFGTYAYRRMPFGLCNALATFQRCMLSIFSDMVERIMEVFMDDITIYGGIVLGHIISEKGIEVDKAKVELIVKLPSPTTVKGVRQFLGHVGFYRRFIKDFSKLSKPLCELLAKDANFIWDERCQKSFDQLKQFLTTAPIGLSSLFSTDHSALKYLLTKKGAKARLIRWILLLQEFDLQIRDKKRVENVVADHLSSLAIAHNSHVLLINDPEESLMLLEKTPWKHFFAKIHAYYWEEPFLFKYCANQIIRKCGPEEEQQGILNHCHENACGGHFASQKIAMKVLQSGFTWPSLFQRCPHNV
ncbi:Retrovirus-related Pol polyprotein from transposon 17.6 [Vitis vinifera]|uniref:Retrovirus-related Pol polyprotein from transposon 17.6 n=1 Tax=Vitis vinifera TaxID=29760 RepID=A0A438CZ70_VITVI|nr:Retrovirus-related Pol polyprotein from transposon 17.6 [Vitis vinifera]